MPVARPGGFSVSWSVQARRTLVTMSALLWWLIPIGATIIAVLWVSLRSRPAKPMDGHDGMARLRRFQHAMERPLPQDRDASADRW